VRVCNVAALGKIDIAHLVEQVVSAISVRLESAMLSQRAGLTGGAGEVGLDGEEERGGQLGRDVHLQLHEVAEND